MERRLKRFQSLLFSLCMLCGGIFSGGTDSRQSLTRMVHVSDLQEDDLSEYADDPDEEYVYDGFLDEVILYAKMTSNADQIRFTGVTTPSYGSAQFDSKFKMETMEFENCFEYDGLSSVDIVQAYCDERGGLDADIPFVGTDEARYHVQMSRFKDPQALEDLVHGEYTNDEVLEEDLWGLIAAIVAAVVVVYVVVAETAEQIRAEINYDANRLLEDTGEGVDAGNYVYDQRNTSNDGYKAGRYQFGFTDFAGVGCEVASVYNLCVAKGLGSAKRLSDVIHDFESWGIEWAVAWGYWGSSARQIGCVLSRYGNGGFTYFRYHTKAFFVYVNQYLNDPYHLIISTWNADGNGYHTYYIYEQDRSHFHAYNFYGPSIMKECQTFSSLEDIFCDPSVGLYNVGYYIV